MVSIEATELCCGNTKAELDNMQINEWNYVPTKTVLQEAAGWIQPVDHSLPNHDLH